MRGGLPPATRPCAKDMTESAAVRLTGGFAMTAAGDHEGTGFTTEPGNTPRWGTWCLQHWRRLCALHPIRSPASLRCFHTQQKGHTFMEHTAAASHEQLRSGAHAIRVACEGECDCVMRMYAHALACGMILSLKHHGWCIVLYITMYRTMHSEVPCMRVCPDNSSARKRMTPCGACRGVRCTHSHL